MTRIDSAEETFGVLLFSFGERIYYYFEGIVLMLYNMIIRPFKGEEVFSQVRWMCVAAGLAVAVGICLLIVPIIVLGIALSAYGAWMDVQDRKQWYNTP